MLEMKVGDLVLHHSGSVVKITKLYDLGLNTQSWVDFHYQVGFSGVHVGACFLSNLSPLPKSCQYLYA